VALRAASRRTQRGMALLGLLAVAVMVFAYVLTSRLNAASRFVGIDREHNAKVLSQAKQALVGWMAINAATDNNPGRLPCPEAVNAIGTDSEGIAAPLVTPSTPNCATVGRLPWRTLGLSKIVDAASEPLWYVVSPGWALQNSSTLLTINSDSRGNMVVDGQAAPNEVVALIIAAGPAMNVQAATGCTARAQARAAAAPAMNPLDYIECFDAAAVPPVFSTTGPATSLNDQVVRVTVRDLMPALEAAIADRMQREIAPALRTVYALDSNSPRRWVASSTNPVYPYAAVFANPNPGTSNNYEGSATTYQGLLPFVRTQGCSPGTDERCTSLAWTGSSSSVSKIGGYGSINTQSCSGSTVRVCTGEFQEDSTNEWGAGILLEMTATIDDVAMGLRALDWSKVQVHARNMDPDAWQPVALEPFPETRAVMNANGSVTIRVRARLPIINAMSWETWAEYRVTLDKAVISDHVLLDTATSNPLGWFVRNQWFRSTYYAVAQASTAGGSSGGCNNTNCLRFNEGLGCGIGANWCNIRALLVLGGASLSNPAGRPNGDLADYVEYTNADGGTFYEQHPMRRATNVANPNGPWNDRVILVDWPASLPPLLTGTHPQVVSVSPLRVYVLP
jgi:hypothetical protein